MEASLAVEVLGKREACAVLDQGELAGMEIGKQRLLVDEGAVGHVAAAQRRGLAVALALIALLLVGLGAKIRRLSS
jgi:hypothetical protein